MRCPCCGKNAEKILKEWKYSGFQVKLVSCPSCRKNFKAYYYKDKKEGEKLSHTIPKEGHTPSRL